MQNENATTSVSLSGEKTLSQGGASFGETVDNRQLENKAHSLEQTQQLSPTFPAISADNLSQMSLYPPRYYYQYYMPNNALPPSAFGACGMYGNLPGSDGKSKRKTYSTKPLLYQLDQFNYRLFNF